MSSETPAERPVWRDEHVAWLTELTQVPTAAGREGRVIEWVRGWVRERPELVLGEDEAGNLTVEFAGRREKDGEAGAPIYVTGHLDHPAFVVERIVGPGTLEVSFRGGVMEVFFEAGARIVVHTEGGERLGATITGPTTSPTGAYKCYLAELDEDVAGAMDGAGVGDVGTWALPPAEIVDGCIHTHACDDLAAVAAALGMMDVLVRRLREGARLEQDVRLLLTRAEEIGFVGAIAACKAGTMPRDSRVIALENSRSFADSPIGGGPIVRVGDRMSVFTPWLTSACAKRAEEVFARPATPAASQTASRQCGAGTRAWQRKLMAGGACEASVFVAYGYAATCLCLPLGNYHNMPHLAELQDETYDRERLGPARAAREFVSLSDFEGMVDLLVALAERLPAGDVNLERIERLYAERRFVLEG
ncbi:MAG: hypothetical protein KF745_11770 [Phycisphaeraceae bacterium]|nr:hypothetical protein [Phycisphaeraceae bacterium]